MTVEIASPFTDFVSKLERRSPLPPDARAAFHALPHSIMRAFPGDKISDEGATSRCSLFVSSGFVSRQKRVRGTAQIMGVGIAGDSVDLQSLWFHQCDHSLVAHAPSTLISVEHRDIIDVCELCPALNRALWHDTLVDAAIFREWALNLGHRPAKMRIAHLMLELATRQRSHGLISGDTFELPLTQSEFGSALGLSLVHTNKSLKALREARLLLHANRQIEIYDRRALEELAGFDPGYLHIDKPLRFEPRS